MTECFLNRWGGQAEEGPCEDRFWKHILNADDALYGKQKKFRDRVVLERVANYK